MTKNERIDGFIEILKKIENNDPWKNNNDFLTHGQIIRLAQGLSSVFPRSEFQTNITVQVELLLEAMSIRGIPHVNRSEFAKQIINLLLVQKEHNEFVSKQKAKDKELGLDCNLPVFF